MARSRTPRSPQPRPHGDDPRRPRTANPRASRPPLSVSQNFLARRTTAERIADLAAPAPDGLVLEIGAGRGILTAALADRVPDGTVVAHELDDRLVRMLRDGVARRTNVRLAPGDFLTAHPPHRPYTVVGNIPYARTADIVDWCLRAAATPPGAGAAPPRLGSATLVTQLEYARKRTGGYRRWSRVTVLSWPDVDWRLLDTLPRGEFRPVPRVDSAVLRIDRRPVPLLLPAARRAWRDLVDLGFSGVGGTLHASLRRAHPRARVDAAFRAAGLPRTAVVGYVTPDQWLALFGALGAAGAQWAPGPRGGSGGVRRGGCPRRSSAPGSGG